MNIIPKLISFNNTKENTYRRKRSTPQIRIIYFTILLAI